MAEAIDLTVFDISDEDLGVLPSFDPWHTGEYKDIKAVLELRERGSEKENNLWVFAEVRVTFTEDSVCDLRAEEDPEPKAGDYTQFTYNIKQTDNKTGKVYSCAGKHTTPDGTVREGGGLTRLLRDWGVAVDASTPSEVAAILSEGVTINAEMVRNLGSLDSNGEHRVNQYINNIELA